MLLYECFINQPVYKLTKIILSLQTVRFLGIVDTLNRCKKHNIITARKYSYTKSTHTLVTTLSLRKPSNILGKIYDKLGLNGDFADNDTIRY